ncbi:MAG: hypothetical protein KGL39_32020 [Patescibacteria group bacterium]|nr:hypothetical protein [Patescibacteria group bacterium]
MPYQKGQAAKADALEAKLAGAAQGAVDGCVTPVSNPPLPDKLTDSDIERVILRERYISPEGWFQGESTLTVCILTLRNGYEVTGTSACVGPKNYDWTVGRKLARENAKNKVWELEGYLLKQKRWEQGL